MFEVGTQDKGMDEDLAINAKTRQFKQLRSWSVTESTGLYLMYIGKLSRNQPIITNTNPTPWACTDKEFGMVPGKLCSAAN